MSHSPLRRFISRRSVLVGAAKGAALSLLAACTGARGPLPAAPSPPAEESRPGASPASKPAAPTELEKVELAFCSQVLCILPFEVARVQGFFREQGLEVNLVYMRGGTQAMGALLSESVDVVGTPMDLVVQAVAQGKRAIMVTSTARLPFFALVASPRAPSIAAVKDLAGKKVGVGNLGTTDHLMARYLLTKEGVDPDSVEFVALGPNLYDVLVQGQVEAGMVQEPGLTLVTRQGGKSLVNFMSLREAQEKLGGAYQFMGLNTRPDILEKRPDLIRKLSTALVQANRWILANRGAAIVQAAPSELVAGGDLAVFAEVLDKFKADLYPPDGKMVTDAVQRVIDVQRSSGAIPSDRQIRAEQVFTNNYVGG